jgi:hypothetical protein
MFPPRTAIRSIVACTLAFGLLATTMSGPAAARPIDARADAPTSSLAGTTDPRQDLRSPDARDAASPVPQDLRSPDARDAASTEQIARSTEAYYQSFGVPVPVAPFSSPAPVSPPADETPWLLISAVAAALAGVLATGALALRHRRTTRVAT